MISQYRPGYKYPTVSTDSAYFNRRNEPEKNGYYKLGFETEADVLGGDADFDDAYVYAKPLNEKLADVYVVKGNTGRTLTLHDWRGATLEANFSTTAHYQQPLLNGSFGMNLSAAVPGMKPWHALYAEYTDWSVVIEQPLKVRSSITGQFRQDNPGNDPNRRITPEQGAFRHNDKANVGFVDTHIEIMGPSQLRQESLWHPIRPPGFWNNVQLE